MTREEQYDLALKIVQLQDKIKEAKKHNKHARLKCNLKKIKALSELGIAFSAIPLAGTLITCAAGWNPFKLNDQEVPAVITTTIDKEGKETVEKDYKIDDEFIHVKYYTAWEKTDNNNYSREIYTYDLVTNIDINNLVKLMNPSEEITKERLEELLKNEIRYHAENRRYKYIREEYTPTLKDSDLKRGGYIELQLIKKDESDIKVQKESKGRHAGLELIKIFLELIGMTCELSFLALSTSFFKKIKEELQESPYYIDTKDLEQQLKANQMLFEAMPYQSLSQEQILDLQEPQKVLKKEPERMNQQGQ